MVGFLLIFLVTFVEYSDSLDYLMENPINVNFASMYELEEIPFLTADEIYLIKKLRPFKNFDDFKKRLHLDPITANLVRPYIYFSKISIRSVKISSYVRKKENIFTEDNYVTLTGGGFRAFFRRKDDVNSYKVRFKSRKIFLEIGNLRIEPLSLALKPVLRFDSSTRVSAFMDFCGVKFFGKKDEFFVSTPSLKHFNLWLYSGLRRYAGIDYKNSLRNTRWGVKLVMTNENFMMKSQLYRRINNFRFKVNVEYATAGFLRPQSFDTLYSSVSTTAGFPIGPAYIKIREYTLFKSLKPYNLSSFSIFIGNRISFMLKTSIYEDEQWNFFTVYYSFENGDTLKFYEKAVSPGNSYAAGIEFKFWLISAGFTVIAPDINDYITVYESGIKYPDYAGSSVPESRFYLLFRKSSGRFKAGTKFVITHKNEVELSGGVSIQWR